MILFESFKKIDSICQKYRIENYTINSDGSIDVEGNVDLSDKRLDNLPLKFGKVTGFFWCNNNRLVSLEGSPRKAGYFYCHGNRLTTLEGGPREIGGSFLCHNNQLVSLKGSPIEVAEDFNCSNNKLISLRGGPNKVGRNFYCQDNKLVTLEGCPEEVGWQSYFYNNPVNEIFKLFKDYNQFKTLLDDYSYLRGTRIIKVRFQEACIEAGIEIPKTIKGYDIV